MADRDTNLLHITVGAAPTGAVSLEHDLRMTKAALLYADRAKLCSPTSSLIVQLLLFGEIDRKQQLEFYEQVLPMLLKDSGKFASARNNIHNYRLLTRKKKRRPDEDLSVARFEKKLNDTWGEMRIIIEEQAAEAGAEGLVTALQSGLLELHPFDVSGQSKDVATQFVSVIGDAISDGTTYPLFDDSTGGLVQASINEGKMKVSDSAVARARHGGLVGELLERLPLFDDASVADVLDIRRELEKPLVRFRGAVIGFAESIKTAAWDAEFTSDAGTLYRQDVAPAILEIEETVKANRELSSLLPKLSDKSLTLAGGSAIGWVISQLSALPEIARSTLGVGIPAAILVSESIREWREKHREVERNQLYFYYKTKNMLADKAKLS
jgi:hypothetical protein